MTVLQTAAVAFGMFSAIPVPQPEWKEENMRYALCAFPLIGAIAGLCWWGWMTLCVRFSIPDLLRVGGLCLIPVFVTGGIHLDGYADVCDARSSYEDAKRKLEIMADPHCGAFAVIRLCGYFAAYFALCGGVNPEPRTALCMGLGFVLERALSGFAITAFPLAKDTGLAHAFSSAAHRTAAGRVLLVLSVLLGGALLWAGGLWGAAMVGAALLSLRRYYVVSQMQFGGITGDLAGWFLQRTELWMLAALTAAQVIERNVL